MRGLFKKNPKKKNKRPPKKANPKKVLKALKIAKERKKNFCPQKKKKKFKERNEKGKKPFFFGDLIWKKWQKAPKKHSPFREKKNKVPPRANLKSQFSWGVHGWPNGPKKFGKPWKRFFLGKTFPPAKRKKVLFQTFVTLKKKTCLEKKMPRGLLVPGTK